MIEIGKAVDGGVCGETWTVDGHCEVCAGDSSTWVHTPSHICLTSLQEKGSADAFQVDSYVITLNTTLSLKRSASLSQQVQSCTAPSLSTSSFNIYMTSAVQSKHFCHSGLTAKRVPAVSTIR